MEENKLADKFNIMVIGDEEVGKTTILERYFNRKFNSERKKTIGVEYYLKPYTHSQTNLNYNIKFWDTAGQERFQSVTKNYYQRAHGMIITMAINKRSSFTNLKMWINSIREGTSSTEIPLIVVCNKCDLEEEREVENSEIEKFCQEENIKTFFTSAKNGKNIDESFDSIINLVVKKNASKKEENERNNRVDLNTGKVDNPSGSKCC